MAWKSASRLILCWLGVAPLDPAHPNVLAVGVFFDTHRLVAMDQHIRVVGVFMSTLSTSNLPSLPRHCTSTAGRSLLIIFYCQFFVSLFDVFHRLHDRHLQKQVAYFNSALHVLVLRPRPRHRPHTTVLRTFSAEEGIRFSLGRPRLFVPVGALSPSSRRSVEPTGTVKPSYVAIIAGRRRS